MTEVERKKIYTLLSKFYPNARQLKDRSTLTAWGLVLEQFPYDAVKSSVLSYAARNKYFPDLADITGGLPHQPEEEQISRSVSMGEKERQDLKKSMAWQQEWHEHLRSMGLPTLREAVQANMTPGQWLLLLQEKGAWRT